MAKSDTWLWVGGGLLLLLAMRKPKPPNTAKALPASTGPVQLAATAPANGAKVAR